MGGLYWTLYLEEMRNSTIITKKKPCKSCGRVEYIFSRGRCTQCAKIEDFTKRMEEETESVIQEEDLSGLIEDADTIFSRFVRLKYANENGIVKCYTCDLRVHWSMIQNGHFVKRANLYTRWMEDNCRPQCRNCNEVLYGNILIFRQRLEADNIATEILMDSLKLVHKPTREEIRQIIAEYTPKVKQLKSQLKL